MKRTVVVLASAGVLALSAVASSAHVWGPGYHDGYSPRYYGYPYSGPTYYYIGPAYGLYTRGPYYDGYGFHYPRVVSPASAYNGGPRLRHHRWHRD
jgi:hypothetical protein